MDFATENLTVGLLYIPQGDTFTDGNGGNQAQGNYFRNCTEVLQNTETAQNHWISLEPNQDPSTGEHAML